MAEDREYDVDITVTVTIRERTRPIPLASVTLTDDLKANSYDPKHMISAVLADALNNIDHKVMSHVRRIEDVERSKQ